MTNGVWSPFLIRGNCISCFSQPLEEMYTWKRGAFVNVRQYGHCGPDSLKVCRGNNVHCLTGCVQSEESHTFEHTAPDLVYCGTFIIWEAALLKNEANLKVPKTTVPRTTTWGKSSSDVTLATDAVLLNGSLVGTRGSESHLRAVLVIVVPKFHCLQ